MPSSIFSYSTSQPYSASSVEEVAKMIRIGQSGTSHLAFAFVSSDYLPHIADFCDILRVDGRITEVVGCSGIGLINRDREEERAKGFSVLAISAPETKFEIEKIQPHLVIHGHGHGMERTPSSKLTWIPLLNPYDLPVDQWVQHWNAVAPKAYCTGGLASGSGETTTAVFYNGKVIEGGVVVGFSGGSLRMRSLVSQGCRPIGEPLTVTKAENNVVYALGAHPAYQALESAFQTLSEAEKISARGNLFAGLATNEYLEDFLAGDFLIRNIIGADPESGAVVIGGIPRVGQTLQYQYRDREASSNDLAQMIQMTAMEMPTPLGALLFCCLGRGEKFFGIPNHDLQQVQGILGPHPAAGFLCSGEIGPVHSVNCVTAFTAAIGLFYDQASE